MTKDDKLKVVDILAERYQWEAAKVLEIEPRLCEYFNGLISAPELHNTYELLGAVKFLRLLRTYEFNHKKVRQVIRLREGEWQQVGGRWQHVSGGIACPGTHGATVYRFKPFQVFVLASVFGFQCWVDTQQTTADRDTLLPTEKVVYDGEKP